MGGGGQQQSQTSTATPSTQQQGLLNLGQPFAQQYAASGGVQLPGSPIAGFNPNQVAGQNMALQAAMNQTPIAQNAANANQFFTSGAALNPATNPGLSSAIAFATEPIAQNYQDVVMPSLNQGAEGTGGYGGSRQGVAQGLAARGEEQAVGTTAANLTNQNYLAAMNAMTQNEALAPGVAQLQTAPALTTSGVGDVQQALQQAQNTYGWNANVFQQQQPMSVAEELMGLAAGIPGGSTTTTGQVNNQMNPLQMAMGLGSLGSSLFGGQNGMFSSMGGLSGLGSGLSSGLTSLGSSLAGGLGSMGSGISSLLPFLFAA